MADYVDDSGTHNYDAILNGTENTDWAKDPANKTLKMLTPTGEADTGFVLPSNEPWLLIETFNVGEIAQGAGQAGWLGFHKYQSDVSQVDTDLSTYRATVDAEYEYYTMKATLYDGAGAAKVYVADNTTAFPLEASPTYTVPSWTPPTGNWKITDTVVAPISRLETNGDFLTSGNWTTYYQGNPAETGTITYDSTNKQYDWNSIISNSGIYQTINNLTPSGNYTIEFKISNYSSGSITARLEGMTPIYVYKNANGVYTQDITNNTNTSNNLWLQADYGIGFSGSVDYIKLIPR